MRYIGIFCFLFFLGACTSETNLLQYEEIPLTGDVARGEVLFSTQQGLAPACSVCHIPENPASPILDGFGAVAGSRIEGMSAREYAFQSIFAPGDFIVEGFGNAMYANYGDVFSAQDIADMLAYLLSR